MAFITFIMGKTLFLLIIGSIFFGVILFMPEILYAQIPPPPPNEPTQNPIDGGLAVLAAAGGAYAIKKLRDKKK